VTGRARGGNDIHLRFDGRNTSLHSVWDGNLISKVQQTVGKVHYDEFLEYLLQLLETRYLNSMAKWLSCPYPADNPQLVLNNVRSTAIVAQEDCVENWMEDTHRLNCAGVWSFDTPEVYRESFLIKRNVVAKYWAKAYGIKEVHEKMYGEYFDVDLSLGSYWQWVLDEDVVPLMLIRGGVRLAGVLNGIFDGQ
jgi:nuclease S1